MNRIIVGMLAGLALFYVVSGLLLFVFSQDMFESLPSYYGAFNNHFVKDAGLAFLSSGMLLVFSLNQPSYRYPYCLAASIFVVLHGVFHVQMLVSGMIPSEFIIYELVRVIAPALLLLVLVIVLYKNSKEEPCAG